MQDDGSDGSGFSACRQPSSDVPPEVVGRRIGIWGKGKSQVKRRSSISLEFTVVFGRMRALLAYSIVALLALKAPPELADSEQSLPFHDLAIIPSV